MCPCMLMEMKEVVDLLKLCRMRRDNIETPNRPYRSILFVMYTLLGCICMDIACIIHTVYISHRKDTVIVEKFTYMWIIS